VRLRGVSFDKRSRPFDCFQQVYPASEIVFSISGQTARHVFRGTDLRDWSVAPLDAASAKSARASAQAKPARATAWAKPARAKSVHADPAEHTRPRRSLKGGGNV